MKLAVAVFALAMASIATGQTVKPDMPAQWTQQSALSTASGPPTTPTVCSKYKHREATAGHCANTCGVGETVCTAECLYVPASDAACVDNIHLLTEEEWQKLSERIIVLDQT